MLCVFLGSKVKLSHCCGWMGLDSFSHRMLFPPKVCVSVEALMVSDPQPGTQTSCVCVSDDACVRECVRALAFELCLVWTVGQHSRLPGNETLLSG